ncbi:MAG: hypothetical protein R3C10_09635 [Pirellulales bacterium]
MWTQTAGPTVVLANSTTANPTFTAPDVSEPAEVRFQVTVSDGTDTWYDDVTVTVNPIEDYTEVDAGPDQLVDEDALVSLSATVSDSPPALSFNDVAIEPVCRCTGCSCNGLGRRRR